jgi:DNA/RNA endonuclease YhcR with UshA esterase domain
MKSKAVLLVLGAALLFGGMTAYSHHSFAMSYRLDQTVKIEGKITKFVNRNPHSWVFVDVADAGGKSTVWGVESAAATQFARAGITGQTLKAGDVVVVTGNPVRNEREHRVRMVSIVRPADGLSWGLRQGEVVD